MHAGCLGVINSLPCVSVAISKRLLDGEKKWKDSKERYAAVLPGCPQETKVQSHQRQDPA